MRMRFKCAECGEITSADGHNKACLVCGGVTFCYEPESQTLPNDVARCEGVGCKERDLCLRFIDLNLRGKETLVYAYVAGEPCESMLSI